MLRSGGDLAAVNQRDYKLTEVYFRPKEVAMRRMLTLTASFWSY